ncbi:MAG: GNAT family N-acetyltransferase [Crocinitomicaceae bacterium]|nr:GNAT family N-acetyltransferase [Crocinitomicaceae bacterium]
MSQIRFQFIEKENILQIVPLMQKISTEKDEELLAQRILEMADQNYKCLGIFDENKLIGICGLWFLTRHYCGKTVEPDHVVIDEAYQDQGIGKQLFEWIFSYCRTHNITGTELNTYVENTRSHKFYYNLGYEILGYHFLKIIE